MRTEPLEPERRKPGADGVPVRLADGRSWLLALPTFCARGGGLTRPPVDRCLDRVFESAVLGRGLALTDVWEAARALLKENYDLSEGELARLLCVSGADDAGELAAAVCRALFGSDEGEKTYTQWVRASLLANGLGAAEVPGGDLRHVLAVLVATNRTIPLTKFADACRLLDEQARLEALV